MSHMQSFGHVVRRFYATKPPPRKAASALPLYAAKAREASTPMAVRERREKMSPELLPRPGSALTPTEHSTYMRQLAQGTVKGQSRAEWLDRLNARRSRLRGVRVERAKKGELVTKVVGQKIYLPNVIFRMVRNFTPKGQAYNPYEATFRIPQSITKTDVRSYLNTVYGVKTTYIRTANYVSPLRRTKAGMRPVGAHRTYKRAVVGLVDPFYYPQALEDMDKAERKEREDWMDQKFGVKILKQWRSKELARMSLAGSKHWRLTGYLRRDKILQAVARRRAMTAHDLEEVEAELAERRAAGKVILDEKQPKEKRRRATSKPRALTV
ncbi:hypothetical protein HYDPIDRAFT_27822 [Hydnomerulius pinastri MD-312]|uniref:Large ribosomal subunit protein uL23m n=1 Tax=Hydnomerulius pinastri MD-312 TaxID=994086 RepID=A0A0C9WAR9_9AGAM|nr:hypothetical protein HYDPIDRAFT_27822 [Hydnomerulius pinastri MD-312]